MKYLKFQFDRIFDAKEHDKAIAIVLGLTWHFANLIFAKLISSSNISVLKQVSGNDIWTPIPHCGKHTH